MKTMSLVLGSISGLLLLFTAICGLWIWSKKLTDAEALSFHMKLGLSSVAFGVITAAVLIGTVIKK